MAKNKVLYLYKEARLNLEQAFPGSTIAVSLPSHTSPTFGSRPQPKRTVISEKYIDQDEDEFAKKHLASEGSIFFRRIHKYPRSFLWRILDDRRVLEIQSIDLDQDYDNQAEATLTLLLSFPTTIRPFGVAFSEPEDRDALNVFVLTTSNDLYTLNLHRDFFIKPTATDIDIGDWCKTFMSSSLSFRQPYRLIATSAVELLVSLHDGGLLRLSRKPGDDGSFWREIGFKENNWGFKNLISWKGHNTVRFNGIDLEAPAAAAIALSPDSEHIFTVCLNHTLRVWNFNTGAVGIQIDLLGENERDPQKAAQYFIGPSQPVLMQIVDIQGVGEGDLYYVVTYSPKRHQFKFWGIKDANDAKLGIRDVHSDISFIPPVDELMNTTVWNLEEFYIKASPGWRGAEIWIRARSGPTSNIYSLKFDLHKEQNEIENTWKNDWVSVDSGPLTVEGLRLDPSNPGEADAQDPTIHNPSVTERWLEFLFYPGRFTLASLETALYVYRRGLDEKKVANISSKAPLKERICVAIASNIALRNRSSTSMDFDEYESNLGVQWQIFYGLVKDVHKRRGEALSLAFDQDTDIPWLLLSDYISAVRKCSEIETLCSNSGILTTIDQPSGPLARALQDDYSQDIARLLNAAKLFRKSFLASFNHTFRLAVRTEVLQTQLLSVPDRMEAFDQSCNLCAQVTDDDLNKLTETLGLDFQDLTNELFSAVIQRLGQEEQGRGTLKKQITRCGLSALTRISQESSQLHFDILLDLLAIVVFMALDLDKDDLSDEFDPSELYVEIINQLKDYSVLTWLSGTPRSRPVPPNRNAGKWDSQLLKDGSTAKTGFPPVSQTVLEGICGVYCFDFSFPRGPQSEILTYWARMWTLEPFRNQQYDNITANVMSFLLLRKDFDLASDFIRFLPESNWASYLHARLYLAKGEFGLASAKFKRAAFKLSMGHFDVEYTDPDGLISVEERDFFSDGLARYYQHVLNLFEKSKAHSFVADFAKLGLQSLTGQEPAETRTNLLSRLFSASIQTSCFDEAYSALTRHTNVSLRRAALNTFITSMIAQSQAPALLKFPFVNLYNDVDDILASLCQKTLNISTGPPYHKILYAFRIARNDFRGAASILYERLQRLQTTSSKIHDPEDKSLMQSYLILINTLASVQSDQAWILAEQRVDENATAWGIGKAKGILKRRVVTLEDLRKEYQAELDRVSAMENGQFAFTGGDEMDVL